MTTIRKTLLSFIAAIALVLCCAGMAFAQSNSASWNVTFNSDKQMVSDYDKDAVNKQIASMQPGDDLTLKVAIKNDSANSTEWYMTSTVLQTLEDMSEATNGAYTYRLSYDGEELYGSDMVGGDNSSGLKEASNATGSWMYLTSLAPGKGGEVEIYMALDGETQGNSYMGTEGGLQINFAVEDTAEGTTLITEEGVPTDGGSGFAPKMGDVAQIVMYVLCGALILWTALSFNRDRMRREEGDR